jgi:uncharacterized protein DUF3631
VYPDRPRAQAEGAGERWISFLHAEETEALARRLEAWADADITERLRTAHPLLPEGMRDRHVEVWWGLFAIADEAGGTWPARARRAAQVLHLDPDGATMSSSVLLLDHVRRAFEEADRFTTAQLLQRLVENEEGPWGRWWGAEVERTRDGGAPRSAAADLARNLRPFKVKPKVIKMPDGSTQRGYMRADFDEAWSLYLPPSMGDVTNVTNVTPLASRVTSVTSVTSPYQGSLGPAGEDVLAFIRSERAKGSADSTVAALLNTANSPAPPGFARWTGYAVRSVLGQAQGLA